MLHILLIFYMFTIYFICNCILFMQNFLHVKFLISEYIIFIFIIVFCRINKKLKILTYETYKDIIEMNILSYNIVCIHMYLSLESNKLRQINVLNIIRLKI